MKRTWMMAVLSIKDSLRTKAWIPFIIMSVLAWFPMLMGFGFRLRPNAFANNIISNYFHFLSMGVCLSGLILGATSIYRERRASMIFTLPISRGEIAAGKLLGTQIVVAGGLLIGYLISLAFAVHFGLTSFGYSWLALTMALSVSFTYLCISIPLGFWMSPVPVAVTTFVVVLFPSILDSLVQFKWITNVWIARASDFLLTVIPGQLDTTPLSKAFYSNSVYWGDYASVGRDVLLALAFFILLSTLARRKELSTKS
jgi:hypothetical protein